MVAAVVRAVYAGQVMAKRSRFVLLVLLACGACKGKQGDTTPKDAEGIAKVDPTLCDTNGKNIITYDLNKDGRPDVWRLYKTEDEGGTKIEYMTCKQVDFDHDGRKDWVVGYNRKGQPLFEKADFDYDGKFDMSAVYDPKTGLVAEVERDTDFDGSFDVKEVYDSAGILSSVRRDRNGDGQPDLWEQYKDNVLIAILYDDDFDGKVDRREEIPGARPKIEMPTTEDADASAPITDSPGSSSGGGGASAPAPAANKK
jgi:hypothetical protein